MQYRATGTRGASFVEGNYHRHLNNYHRDDNYSTRHDNYYHRDDNFRNGKKNIYIDL